MLPPTPGAYIKIRRCASGKSVADVAAKIATVPRLAEHARVELLELIEADVTPPTFSTIVVLNNVFPFDIDVLATLERIKLGADLPVPRMCRICACSDYDPCGERHGVVATNICRWVEPDLCSSCATPKASAA